MHKNNYIIATIKTWNYKNFYNIKKKIPGNWFLIKSNRDLTYKKIKKINPKYIFFPHWSHKVDSKIVNEFECVCFHETNLPFGRGGSPIQNLILKKIKKTKVTAFKMDKGIDTGPIYYKNKLSLNGTTEDILKRSSKIIFNIIKIMCKKKIIPKEQKGKVTYFKRRKPSDSQIPISLNNIDKFYDYIRMLDAEGYPNAYIQHGKHYIKFKGAKLKKNCIYAKVEIKKKYEI